MSWEIGVIIGLIVVVIILVSYLIAKLREFNRKHEDWENEVYNLYEKLLIKLEYTSVQQQTKIIEEMGRLDEITQKRYNYLKKSHNDLADRLDIVEQSEKRIKDLHYQVERNNQILQEMSTYLMSPAFTTKQEKQASLPEIELEPEVKEVIDLNRQGVPIEEIAQKLGRAIPEIQLVLHLFANTK